ncbi:MAG: type II toxin-antitoxin system Phd/YefM family antitoxin, partial [Spirochaetaceae bacterium]|nr:type II toxin-antitoxin system Phd/YefM family antitoxin [Spirochaetaceae bacterium]
TLMGTTVKASELRRNLFSLLDQCLSTGTPIEVPRKGGMVRIVPVSRRVPVAQLPRRPGAVVDAGTLDSFSPAEWKP